MSYLSSRNNTLLKYRACTSTYFLPVGLTLSIMIVGLPNIALANCTDAANVASAGAGDSCTAGLTAYTNTGNASPVFADSLTATQNASSLTFTQPDVVIQAINGAARAIRANSGNITFQGNVTVYRSLASGATGNSGYGLDAYSNSANGLSPLVTFEKDATFIVDVANGDGVRAAYGSKVYLNGKTEINAGRFGVHSLMESNPGSGPERSSLVYINDLTINSGNEALKVEGSANNAIVVVGEHVSLTTNDDDGYAGQAQDGGKLFIRSSGGTGSADGNSLIVLDNTNAVLISNGARAHGLQSGSRLGNATIEMAAGSIETRQNDSEGVYALVNGGTGSASVTFTGGKVVTHGTDADGIVSQVSDSNLGTVLNGDALLEMTGGEVRAYGAGAAGLLAETDIDALSSSLGNAIVTQRGGTVSTSGNSPSSLDASHGVMALAMGAGEARVFQYGGSAQTSGQASHALYAFATRGNNIVMQSNGASAIASGVGASAVRALAGLSGQNFISIDGSLVGGAGPVAAISSISFNGSQIDIGANARVDGSASGIAIRDGDVDDDGIDETGGNSIVTIAGHVIGNVIMGKGDDHIFFSAGILDGDIYADDQAEGADDGNDHLEWSGGTWLSNFYAGSGSDTTLITSSNYDGTYHVLDGGDDTSGADGFIDHLTFRGVSSDVHGARLVNWEKLTLQQSQLRVLDGALAVGLDPDSGLFLSNVSTLHGDAGLALNGNLAIDATSQFLTAGAGRGLYSVAGTVDNAGTISLQDGAAGDRLTLFSAYQGINGLLQLDTQLGGDDSPTDRLILAGDSQGATLLKVNNIGGMGAQTNQGIKVVEVQGNSTAHFTLKEDYFFEGQPAVVGGAYAYRLYKDGSIATGDEGWYLRSDLDERQIPASQTPPAPQIEAKPHYHPGVPLYESYGLHLLGLSTLPTLQQRIAGRTFTPLAVAKRQSEHALFVPDRDEFWGRVESRHTVYKPVHSSSDTTFNLDLWRMQGGVDRILNESAKGTLIGGLTAHYSQGFSDVSSVHGHGKLSSTGAGLGGTLTWYTPNDFYVDIQGQVSWFSTEINSKTAQQKLAKDNHAYSYNLSFETGKQMPLTEKLFWTPQVQLVHTTIKLDNFKDPFAAQVSPQHAKSTRARLGVSLDKYLDYKDKKSHIYTIANLYRDFAKPNSVKVSGTSFSNRDERNWGEIGFGGSFSWSDKYHLYTELTYASALSKSTGSHTALGNIGFKIDF